MDRFRRFHFGPLQLQCSWQEVWTVVVGGMGGPVKLVFSQVDSSWPSFVSFNKAQTSLQPHLKGSNLHMTARKCTEIAHASVRHFGGKLLETARCSEFASSSRDVAECKICNCAHWGKRSEIHRRETISWMCLEENLRQKRICRECQPE